MTARQLLIWPEGANLAPVKAAFESLDTGFRVSPHWFNPAKHKGRILVLGDGFPWLLDYIHPKAESLLPRAISWCLGLEELDRGPNTVLSILQSKLGDVREIDEADWASGEDQEYR